MIVLDMGASSDVYTVVFHPDGKYLLGGGDDGIRRWRLPDGREVGKQMEMELRAICVSEDRKWVVCGTYNGASVWDGEMDENVLTVEGDSTVWAVDVSPDSTRFATGTSKFEVSIWTITKGERLVGPLQHGYNVTGVQFSPDGEQIATVCLSASIHVFDSRNGVELVVIDTTTPPLAAITPLAWSGDGQRIFATSDYNSIGSTGAQLAELQMPSHVYSLALAPNCKFIATFGDRSISFLDASTLARTGPVITDSEEIRSIAISADSSYLATGRRYDGKFVIRNLSQILPDLYGPFDVGVCVLWSPHDGQAPHR